MPESYIRIEDLDDINLTNETFLVGSGNGNSGRFTLASLNDFSNNIPPQVVNAKNYGAIGDGVTDSTVGLDAAFALLPNNHLYIPPGQYIYDLDVGAGLVVPPSSKITCGGKIHWQPNTNEDHQNNVDGGVVIWFVGSGHKIHTLDNVSAMQASGGRFDNPAWQNHATTPIPRAGISNTSSAQYSLTDFTNEDATGATRATLRKFNCGLIVDAGGSTVIDDLTVGIARKSDIVKSAIYNEPTHDAMADDVDVTLWIKNNAMGRFTGVQTIGYPRMLGLLDSWMPTNEDEPSNEYRLFIGCLFQGGAAFRSGDVYHVISKTASSVTIPWSPSHRFPTSGTIRSGLNTYNYTGLTFTDAATDTLTFTGISDTSTIDVADWVWNVSGVTSGNFGCSGTRFMGCNFPGLMHASRLLETNSLLTNARTYAQAGIEISGSPCRALEFPHNTVLGSGEVGIHMHDCNDVLFSACYGEGQSARETIGGALNIDKGARVIASPFTGNNSRTLDGVTIAYPAGETGQYRDAFSTWNNSMDFSPALGATPSRFGSYGGLFEPRSQANFGKGIDPKDAGIEWELPVGDRLRIGERNGDAIIQSLNGDLELAADTTDDSVVIKLGNDTFAEVTDSAFNVGPSSGDSNIKARDGDLILSADTTDDSLVLKLGADTFAELTDTAFNVGPSSGDAVIRARDNELELRSATTSDAVVIKNGANTALQARQTGVRFGSSGPSILYGTGSPEGVVAADVGSLYLQEDGTTLTAEWRKATGTGTTGWVATGSIAAGGTGGTTASAARTALGLGSLATNNTNISSGTFTPDIDFIAAPTYNSRSGRWVRVGERVWIEIMMDFASLDNTDTSDFTFSGLPFDVEEAPISGTVDPIKSTIFSGVSTLIVPAEYVQSNISARFQLARAGAAVNYNDAGVQSSGVLWVHACVKV